MGDILYTQSVQITTAKNSTPITEKDFEIFPPELFSTPAMSESFGGRYNLPDTTIDSVPGMGSVALGKVFVITPAVNANIQVKFTNSLGTSPALTFIGGRTSVLNMEFTSFSFTNTSGSPVKGRFHIVGD
jgi:hypothetical protein